MIRAQHPAICPACERPIHPGQPIVNVRGDWVHVGCGGRE